MNLVITIFRCAINAYDLKEIVHRAEITFELTIHMIHACDTMICGSCL